MTAGSALTDSERAALLELRELAEPLTLEECGARLGLSAERVRMIERDALRKLWRALRGRSPVDLGGGAGGYDVGP